MRSYAKSLELYARALQVTPGGAQTASKAPGAVGPLGAFPLYVGRAFGSMVIDVDNNWFYDWFGGNCAVTLGHRGFVKNSVGAPLPSLPTDLEVSVAEQLVRLIPCAEQIRFVKTGSEATEAAIRIARAETGRDAILVAEGHYHSWHAWYTVTKPNHPGVPEFYGCGVDVFDGTLSDLASRLDNGVAAVILEPIQLVQPPAGYLNDLIALAHSHGALVIFDEMISGVRWGLGGYQAIARATPDLATFGKAYANGHPLAFVAGPASLMRHAATVSGTFGGECVSLAACQFVLDEYTNGALDRLWDAGRPVRHALLAAVAGEGLPLSVIGEPVRFALEWSAWPGETVDVAKALWQQELAEHGILAHPSGFNPSAAHDSGVIDETVVALRATVKTLGEHYRAGTIRQALRGDLIRPAFARPA